MQQRIWTSFFFNCIMFIVSLRLPKVTTLALKTPQGFSEVFCFPGLCGVSRVCLGMSGSSLFSRRQARGGGSWLLLSSSLTSDALRIPVGHYWVLGCRDELVVARKARSRHKLNVRWRTWFSVQLENSGTVHQSLQPSRTTGLWR